MGNGWELINILYTRQLPNNIGIRNPARTPPTNVNCTYFGGGVEKNAMYKTIRFGPSKLTRSKQNGTATGQSFSQFMDQPSGVVPACPVAGDDVPALPRRHTPQTENIAHVSVTYHYPQLHAESSMLPQFQRCLQLLLVLTQGLRKGTVPGLSEGVVCGRCKPHRRK